MAFAHVEGIAQLETLAARLNTSSARSPLRSKIREGLDDSAREVTGRIRTKVMSEDLPAVPKPGRRQMSEAEVRARRARRGTTALRATIARGVGYDIASANGKQQSVVLRVGTSQLGDKKRLPTAIEQGRWRHPTFGNYLNVTTQLGTPFFYRTIRNYKPRFEDILDSKMNRILDQLL